MMVRLVRTTALGLGMSLGLGACIIIPIPLIVPTVSDGDSTPRPATQADRSAISASEVSPPGNPPAAVPVPSSSVAGTESTTAAPAERLPRVDPVAAGEPPPQLVEERPVAAVPVVADPVPAGPAPPTAEEIRRAQQIVETKTSPPAPVAVTAPEPAPVPTAEMANNLAAAPPAPAVPEPDTAAATPEPMAAPEMAMVDIPEVESPPPDAPTTEEVRRAGIIADGNLPSAPEVTEGAVVTSIGPAPPPTADMANFDSCRIRQLFDGYVSVSIDRDQQTVMMMSLDLPNGYGSSAGIVDYISQGDYEAATYFPYEPRTPEAIRQLLQSGQVDCSLEMS